LKEDSGKNLLKCVILFREHDIDIPYFNSTYVVHHDHSQHKKDHVIVLIVEHYFRVNIFFITVDKHLLKLNDRFSEQTMEY